MSLGGSSILHLDGVVNFFGVVCSYGWKGKIYSHHRSRDPNSNFFQAEILCRITILAQAALLIVTNTIKQVIRGMTFLVIGITTLNKKAIILAAKDFASILVNLIALPILAMIAVVSPERSLKAASYLNKKLNPSNFYLEKPWESLEKVDREDGIRTLIREDDLFIKNLSPHIECWQRFSSKGLNVEKVIICMTATFQAPIYFVQGFGSALLSGNIHPKLLLSPFVIALSTFIVPFCFDKDRPLLMSAVRVHGIRPDVQTVQ